MSEFNVPPAFALRENSFRIMTREWIKKRHAGFLKSAEKLKGATPMRHPNGAAHREHNVEFFWSDAIWCGDCTLDPLAEFFELDVNNEIFENQGCGETADWANEIFNDEFKAVLPELAHVLEG